MRIPTPLPAKRLSKHAARKTNKIMEQIMRSGEDDADWFEHYGYIMKAMKKCDIAVEYWKRSVLLDSKRQHLVKEIENCSERD